jgi:two-component system, chemotaxis family, protein-glutamate methylesterase/glutaminase
MSDNPDMAEISAEKPSGELPSPGSGDIADHRDLVVIGASAGGVEALSELVRQLPRELPAAVLVTLHVMPTATSVLPTILTRQGMLPAEGARHGQRLERGRIYVAPPDFHLLVADGGIELSHGPRENGHRPGIDPMFRSAAREYGRRVIGVVLSGMLDDGTAGMRVISDSGGATIAQDPADSLYPGMPQSVIDHGVADHVLPVAAIGRCICELLEGQLPDPPQRSNPGHGVAAAVSLDIADDRHPRDGDPSGLTCPECGGALWSSHEGDLLRFRCHVGHAYSVESMEVEQSRALESALWTAVRTLDEQADLFDRIARRSSSRATIRRLETRAAEATRHADLIRETIADLGRGLPEPQAEDRVS